MYWEVLYIRSSKQDLMYEFLYRYFILNNKLALPGIGSFSTENVPAKIDFVSKRLTAPSKNILFANNNAGMDKQLLLYLSKELKLSDTDTVKSFTEFVKHLAKSVVNGGAELPGLGTLQKAVSGEIYFYPEYKSNKALREISLDTEEISNANIVDLYGTVETEIITQKVEIPESEKLHLHDNETDYWWLYALILAIMGIGALAWYYF